MTARQQQNDQPRRRRMPAPGCRRAAALAPPRAGFTLVELILVMGLLAAALALSAPSLSRFVRRRYVENESLRLVAATEYARGEAVSRGVPFRVWAERETGRFGAEPAPGYVADGRAARVYALRRGVRLDVLEGARAAADRATVATFGPDGSPGEDAVPAVRLSGARNEVRYVALARDGWQYVSLPAERYAGLEAARERAAEDGVADAY